MRRDILCLIILLGPLGPALAGNGRTGTIAGTVWMDSPKRPVANAVVYLAGIQLPPPPNTAPVVLDQRHNRFAPHLQLARAGSPLLIQNSDPHLHVLRLERLTGGTPPAVVLRVATPYAGYEKRWLLPAAAEPYLLRARGENGHERMVAYLAVVPHPWAALTDAQGRYQMDGVPVGDHRLFAWHETLGTLAGRVRVLRGRAREVHFDFPRLP